MYGAEQSFRAFERQRVANGYESVATASDREGISRVPSAVQWLEKNPSTMALVGAAVRPELKGAVSALDLEGSPLWRALRESDFDGRRKGRVVKGFTWQHLALERHEGGVCGGGVGGVEGRSA